MGIFDDTSKLFTTYRVRIAFRDRIMGGIPKDPAIVKGWLKAKAGINDEEELRRATIRTLRESGKETPETATYEEMDAAFDQVEDEQHTNGFKRDERGIYLESRIVKAMLREVTNILFAGERWGVTLKGPKSFVAERVFVRPNRIYLDRDTADGKHLFVGHVSGAQGPQSTLTYFEYAENAEIAFNVLVARDCIDADIWPELWVLAQENGLGALRSQSFGTFDVLAWDVVTQGAKDARPTRKMTKAAKLAVGEDARAAAEAVA